MKGFKRLFAAVAILMLTTVAAAPAALAHSGTETGAGGLLLLNPKAPVAGQPTDVTISVVADDGHPLTEGTMTGSFSQAGKEPIAAAFTESPAGSGQYHATITFAAKDWHGELRFAQGQTKLITDVGFTVFASAGESYGVRDSRLVSWRQPGVATAPAWTDTATWVILVAAPIIGALALWRKQGAGIPGAPLRSATTLIPSGLMTLAAIGALAMPFSGYWDIAWHHDQGRDGLLSPPHLGIYGGITLALISLTIGVWKAGGLKKIKQFPALAFAIAAMIVQLSSAPLDELWHRVMGLDISVWAPPHDMLIFGAAFSYIGMAAVQAAADPEGKSRSSRLRIMTFGLSGLWILNAFLAEFEFAIPQWHISQSRPVALYPALLALALAATLMPAARLVSTRWSVTKMMAVFLVLRALEISLYLPALHRATPNFPPLVLLPAAVVADLVLQSARAGLGRYRYTLSAAAAAVTMFVLYVPLAPILPVKAVPGGQLLLWAPLATLVAGATGYLAGWLGDYALTGPKAGRPPVDKGITHTA
jgi:hypothetical protein